MCATLISSHFCTLPSSQYEKVVSISSYCHSPLLSQIRSHHTAAQSKPERRREDRKWSVMTFVNVSRSFGWKKTAARSGKTNPVAGLAMTCGVNVKLALRNQELSQHSFAPHVSSECPCRPPCPQGGGAGGYVHVSYMLCRNFLKSIYRKR